jgi:hypothetical protein
MESSTLKERVEEKAEGALHLKCRSKKRKVSSFLSLHFFSFSMVFFSLCFFFFSSTSKEENKKGKLPPFFAFFFFLYGFFFFVFSFLFFCFRRRKQEK